MAHESRASLCTRLDWAAIRTLDAAVSSRTEVPLLVAATMTDDPTTRLYAASLLRTVPRRSLRPFIGELGEAARRTANDLSGELLVDLARSVSES